MLAHPDSVIREEHDEAQAAVVFRFVVGLFMPGTSPGRR
jgi:hypothetical protein